MTLNSMLSVLVVLSIGAAGAASASDIQAGKSKAGPCAVCHGANGEGKGNNPPIAGMAPARFVQAMNDYRSGKRTSAAMQGYAAKLGAAETADLAAYYASLKK
jgi:cytochrome c553